MAFFEDLTVHTYSSEPEASVLNVGWLGEGEPFPTGETSEAFQTALRELCANNAIHLYFGWHDCEFCPAAIHKQSNSSQGNGEIRVRGNNRVWYVTPIQICHYLEVHGYRPPQEFIDAVLNPVEIGKAPESRELSEEEEIEQIREHDKRRRELGGPQIAQSEIDEIVRQGIRKTRSKNSWWRFW